MANEQIIDDFKNLYKRLILHSGNRQEVIIKLQSFVTRYYPFIIELDRDNFISDWDLNRLTEEIEDFLTTIFGIDIHSKFIKPTVIETPQLPLSGNLAFDVGSAIVQIYKILNKKHSSQKVINHIYRYQYLHDIHTCLLYFGLHNEIFNRDKKEHSRYNVIIDYKRNRKTNKEIVRLLSYEKLNDDFLTAYQSKKPILINGVIVTYSSIERFLISSTVMKDDEIVYFKQKHSVANELDFISICTDETNNLLRNPFLIEERGKYRNQGHDFIDPKRIHQLKEIRNSNVDLSKLIQLCEELNSISPDKNFYSASYTIRALIDHIPPIFKFTNFTEFANNYRGTKSFKRSMQNLDNSLKNIADHNIHSQVRQKEVLPTKTQIDFSPDIDVLLAEIIRVL